MCYGDARALLKTVRLRESLAVVIIRTAVDEFPLSMHADPSAALASTRLSPVTVAVGRDCVDSSVTLQKNGDAP